MSKKHTVVVILEALPGKEKALEAALSNVLQQSRAETACIEYRLHQSLDNVAQFILYENWVNKEKHQAQFTKPYILTLGSQLESLLAKPYQAFFAQELHAE